MILADRSLIETNLGPFTLDIVYMALQKGQITWDNGEFDFESDITRSYFTFRGERYFMQESAGVVVSIRVAEDSPLHVPAADAHRLKTPGAGSF